MLRSKFTFLAIAAASSLIAVPAQANDIGQILGMVNQMARIAQQAQGQRGYQPQGGYAPRNYYDGQRAPSYGPQGYGGRGYQADYGRPAQNGGYSGYDRPRHPTYASGNLSDDPERNCWLETRMRPDRLTGQMVQKKVAVCE